MEGVAKLLTLLMAQPLFVMTGLLSLGGLLFVVQPIWRMASKRLEQRLESDWESGDLNSTCYRIEAFVLIAHSAIALGAALWCAFGTNYPAPGIGPEVKHPFGPELTRIWAYSLSVAGGFMALMAILLRSVESLVTVRSALFRHMPRAMLVGIAASIAFLCYSIIADISLLGLSFVPNEALRSIPWLYCWMSFLSISMAIFVYVPLIALRGLWRLTASIP